MLHVQHSETEKTSTAKKRKSRIAAISVTLCQLLPKRRSWQDCPLIPFTSPRLPEFPLCSVAWHVAIAIVVRVTYTYYVYAKYGPLASLQTGCLPDLVGSPVLPVSLQLVRSQLSFGLHSAALPFYSLLALYFTLQLLQLLQRLLLLLLLQCHFVFISFSLYLKPLCFCTSAERYKTKGAMWPARPGFYFVLAISCRVAGASLPIAFCIN